MIDPDTGKEIKCEICIDVIKDELAGITKPLMGHIHFDKCEETGYWHAQGDDPELVTKFLKDKIEKFGNPDWIVMKYKPENNHEG